MVEPSHAQISELREAFLTDLEVEGEDSIHPNDLKRIKTNDDWLRRFLLHHENDHKLALAMMKTACAWRKDNNANDIADVVRKDYLIEGGFFPFGRDKDGCTMLVFKCKKHVKGAREMEEIKKAVIYWLERLDREENGKPITMFFDMDQCGLANMDLEFTKFLVHIMKEYYPYFLNYIIIFEMAWILNAAFKVIKSWMPEKARQKIKMLKKPELKEYVPVEQQMTSWGGPVDYTFSFVEAETSNAQLNSSNKKVHFADGSEMTDSSTMNSSGDREDGSMLSVHPANFIKFVKDGSELVSTLELQNVDSTKTLSYKMKTTSPEKFRVRPSAGFLQPGAKVTIHVNLLPGFQLGGLSRDKFLVMSIPVASGEMSPTDLTEFWKNVNPKEVTQHRLSCREGNNILVNGHENAIESMHDDNVQIKKIMLSISELTQTNKRLQGQLKTMHFLQIFLIFFVLVMGVVLGYLIRTEFHSGESSMSCVNHHQEL